MIGIHTLFSCVKENYLFHSVCNLRLVHTGSSTHTHTTHARVHARAPSITHLKPNPESTFLEVYWLPELSRLQDATTTHKHLRRGLSLGIYTR